MTATSDHQALEDERDLLLHKLDGLDQELATGDLDLHDYESLRDDYTARAATVLRQLDPDAEPAPTSAPAPTPAARRLRAVGVGVVLLGFAVAAGLLLARTAGERGVNDQLTGEIALSPRQQVLRCQELGSVDGDLLGAIQCFDEVLAAEPASTEALAYRGWYLILASGVLQEEPGSSLPTGEVGELVTAGVDYLERAVDADPTYPDPLAFRAAVNDRLGETDAVCADIAQLVALDPPQFYLDQTTGLADRNSC